MKFRRLGILKPRHPKSEKEWRAKILVAFALALVFEVAMLFGDIGISVGEAYGTYNPDTDEIWVDPELEEYGMMVVTAHEEAHQSFYNLLPFWSLIKISIMYLFPLALILSVLALSKKLLVAASCVLFIVFLAEIHAYGITLLMFGVSEYTLPGLIVYGGIPLALCVVGPLMIRPRKEPEFKFKGTYKRFSRRDRRRLVVYGLTEFLTIMVFGMVIGYILIVRDINLLVAFFLLVDYLIFEVVQRKQRRMGVVIAKKIRVKTTTAK